MAILSTNAEINSTMICLTAVKDSEPRHRFPLVASRDVPHPYVGRGDEGGGTEVQQPTHRGGGDATVYVVTAGSGDMYRIERIYLDSEQAYGFAQDSNGIAPDPGGRRLVCYQPSWKSI